MLAIAGIYTDYQMSCFQRRLFLKKQPTSDDGPKSKHDSNRTELYLSYIDSGIRTHDRCFGVQPNELDYFYRVDMGISEGFLRTNPYFQNGKCNLGLGSKLSFIKNSSVVLYRNTHLGVQPTFTFALLPLRGKDCLI